jgi:hypothetical protein
MINWIRWNFTKLIIGIVALAIAGGGLYAVSSLGQAENRTKAASTLDGLLECDTTDCIEESLKVTSRDDLPGILDELRAEDTTVATQPTAIRFAGGRCVVGGMVIGKKFAEGLKLSDLTTVLTSLDVTPSASTERNAYLCQFGFIAGLAEEIGNSTSQAELGAFLPSLCGESLVGTTGDRYRFEASDGLCQIVATGTLVVSSVVAVNEKPSWADIVTLCAATGEHRESKCLFGAVSAIRALTIGEIEYGNDDCAKSTRIGYCTMILADARASLGIADLIASKDLAEAMTTFCSDAGDASGCRHGFYMPFRVYQGIEICNSFGKYTSECYDVVYTRELAFWTMFSTVKGDDLTAKVCTLPASSTQCKAIAGRILEYTYRDGII